MLYSTRFIVNFAITQPFFYKHAREGNPPPALLKLSNTEPFGMLYCIARVSTSAYQPQ